LEAGESIQARPAIVRGYKRPPDVKAKAWVWILPVGVDWWDHEISMSCKCVLMVMLMPRVWLWRNLVERKKVLKEQKDFER
jgi:hypothetical protein